MNTAMIIQKSKICSGCGVCAGICPTHCLTMLDNEKGEYRPALISDKCANCGQCLRACPFLRENSNSDAIASKLFSKQPTIQYKNECGYYVRSYVGFSKEHRRYSASGGLTTYFLEQLLRQGLVNYIVCVQGSNDYKRLFNFKIVSTVDDLRSGSRSCYYPVEMSDIIRKIKKTPGIYAVTGLPCFIRGLRNACLVDNALRKKIKFMVGLVCAHLPSKNMVEFIANANDVKLEQVKKVQFRVKQNNGDSSTSIQLHISDGRVITEMYNDHNSFFGVAFLNKAFTQKSCELCDDTFAECADIVFMDAWLPQYSHIADIEGLSLAIARNDNVVPVIETLIGKTITYIDIDQVVFSQEKGVIKYKRDLIYLRYSIEKLYKDKNLLPQLRFRKKSFKYIFWAAMILIFQRLISYLILYYYERNFDSSKCKKLMSWLKFINLLTSSLKFPIHMVMKLKRNIVKN